MAARTGLLEWVVEQEDVLRMVSEFVGGDAQAACQLLGIVPTAWRRVGYYRMLMTGYWLECRMRRLRWELRAVERRHRELDEYWRDGTIPGLPRWLTEAPMRRHPEALLPQPTREEAQDWHIWVVAAWRNGERRSDWLYPNVSWRFMNEGNEPPDTPYRDRRGRHPFRET